jgi:hypothetical protein
MSANSPRASFWKGVWIIWRFETRRRWMWRYLLFLLGMGVLGCVFVFGVRDQVLSHVLRPIVVWEALWGLVLPSSRHWHLWLAASEPLTYRVPPSVAVHVALGSAFVALQHYLLPAIAGLAIVKESESQRLDDLRMTGTTPSQMLVGKWLGVLTPFAVLWTLFDAVPMTGSVVLGDQPRPAVPCLSASLLLLVSTTLLGLCASACCRRSSTAVAVAYVLCWTVPFAATCGARLLLIWREFEGTPRRAAYFAVVFSDYASVTIASVFVTAFAFAIALGALRRRWRSDE